MSPSSAIDLTRMLSRCAATTDTNVPFGRSHARSNKRKREPCFKSNAALPEAPDSTLIIASRQATNEPVKALAERRGGVVCYASGNAAAGRVMQDDPVRALAQADADLNAPEHQAYDIVTIAAVANDVEIVDLALPLGANAGNVTSPYEGTATGRAPDSGTVVQMTMALH